jgi:hypothetical protein
MRKTILAASLMLAFGAANAQNVGVISGSESESNANSSSHSGAAANSGGNEIKPNQQVGISTSTQFNQTFEAANIPTTTTQKWKGNNSVPLAAAVSFSSDYCGGTASGGLSGFGLSAGLSAPKMDGNCQALRRAEKFGTAAANAYNAGMKDIAAKLIAVQVWEICMAGNDAKVSYTAEACQKMGLLDAGNMPHEAAAHEQLPAQPAQTPTPPQEYQPRQPRGEVSDPSEASKKVTGAHTVRIRGSNGVEKEYEVDRDGRMVH